MRRNIGRNPTIGVIGIAACIAGGTMAARYAVGGIDPFYQHAATSADRTSGDVAVLRDDEFLPPPNVSAGATPLAALPTVDAPSATAQDDWDAIDPQMQRELDRALKLADAPLPDYHERDPGMDDVLPSPPPEPPRRYRAPTAPDMALDGREAPVVPNGTLIY